MRLADFLILVLQAHGKILVDLKALVGEEELLRALNSYDPPAPSLQSTKLFEHFPLKPRTPDSPMPFEAFEHAVRELKMKEDLEFFVWAYPYYRCIAESSTDLNEKLPFENAAVIASLVQESADLAALWVADLPVDKGSKPELRTKLREISQQHWIRFRSELYRKTGQSPFQRV